MVVSLAALGALVASCSPQGATAPQKGVRRAAGEIVGGRLDSSPGAVALVVGTNVICSATLVSPHAVLTTASCLTGHETDTIIAFFGNDLNGVGTNVPITTRRVHMGFDPLTLENNLAVLELMTQAPVAAVPYPRMGETPLEDESVRVIGFGVSDPADPTSAGIKRSALSTIVQMDDEARQTFVGAWADGARACFGDQGGPAVVDRDGAERLVGIVSASDDGCGQNTLFVRVETFWPSFVGPALFEIQEARGMPPAPSVSCMELDGRTRCVDGGILSCVDGVVRRTECTAIGGSCRSGDTECRPAESTSGCGMLTFQGECVASSDRLRWCRDETVIEEYDCSLGGEVCALVNAEIGFDCVPAMSSTGCSGGQFTCGDGRCIPAAWRCDCGAPDCEDGSDEADCPTECPSSE